MECALPSLPCAQDMVEGAFSPYRVYMQNVLAQKCGTQVRRSGHTVGGLGRFRRLAAACKQAQQPPACQAAPRHLLTGCQVPNFGESHTPLTPHHPCPPPFPMCPDEHQLPATPPQASSAAVLDSLLKRMHNTKRLGFRAQVRLHASPCVFMGCV